MYAHYHKSYKYSQTMTLVCKLRVQPCSKSLLEVCVCVCVCRHGEYMGTCKLKCV